jgi:hypothetical protein
MTGGQIMNIMNKIKAVIFKHKHRRQNAGISVVEADEIQDVEHTLNAYIFMWLGKAHMFKTTDREEIKRIVREQLERLK